MVKQLNKRAAFFIRYQASSKIEIFGPGFYFS